MHEAFMNLDYPSRRLFLEYAAKSMLGLSIMPAVSAFGASAKKKPEALASKKGSSPAGGTAKNVIYLFMQGAMSHIDSFDLKPGRDVQGATQGISTNVTGMKFGEALPGLAQQADKMAVIRSLTTETGDHEQGKYLMRTSYKEIASIRHPGVGAWAMKLQGKRNEKLPDNVVIGAEPRHPGAGFLEPSFSPLPIADPIAGLQNTKSPAYLTDDSFNKRMKLIDGFDSSFRKKYPQKQVEAYNEFYNQAVQLLSSDELKAFDLKQEKDDVIAEYGKNPFGQGCLLARRLVENKVRFVEVTMGGWDMHIDVHDKMATNGGLFDKAVAALLKDLAAKGLLKDTLVVCTTEFGRSPKINQNAGRDHHPGAFSGFFAGGGIKGGQFYGKSDDDGHSVADNVVKPADMNATIALALGLPLDKEIHSKSGRPFKVAHDGGALETLF